MAIKITSDSTCDLAKELLEKHDIELFPLYITLGGKTLRDGVEITPDDIFAHVAAGGALASTAAVTPNDYETRFAQLSREYDAVIHINISSDFSACHQNARIAAENYKNVYVVDSRNLSSGHGHVVMEAALRTAVETITGKTAETVEFTDVRGTEGVKEAEYDINGLKVKVAVASGLVNARKVLDMVKSGEKDYTFIEIMGCPGGCVNGGGQPIQPASVRNFVDLKGLRAAALYKDDENLPIRKSHENPVVKTLYDEYFEKPGSHRAHEILHTHYTARPKINVNK